MEIGWTLGFVLNESGTYPVDLPEVTMETLTFALCMVLFIMFILMGVALAIQGTCSRKSRLQNSYKRFESYGAI